MNTANDGPAQQGAPRMRLDPAAFKLVMVPVIAQDPPDLPGGRRANAPRLAKT